MMGATKGTPVMDPEKEEETVLALTKKEELERSVNKLKISFR